MSRASYLEYIKLIFSTIILFIIASSSNAEESCHGYFDQQSSERPVLYLSDRAVVKTFYEPEFHSKGKKDFNGVANNEVFSLSHICGTVQMVVGGKVEIYEHDYSELPFTVDSTTTTIRSNVKFIIRGPAVIHVHGAKAKVQKVFQKSENTTKTDTTEAYTTEAETGVMTTETSDIREITGLTKADTTEADNTECDNTEWGTRSTETDTTEAGTRITETDTTEWGSRITETDTTEADTTEWGTRITKAGAGRITTDTTEADTTEWGTRSTEAGAGRITTDTTEWGTRITKAESTEAETNTIKAGTGVTKAGAGRITTETSDIEERTKETDAGTTSTASNRITAEVGANAIKIETDATKENTTAIDFGLVLPSFANPGGDTVLALNNIVNDSVSMPIRMSQFMDEMENAGNQTVIEISKPFELHIYADVEIMQLAPLTYHQSIMFVKTFPSIEVSFIVKIRGNVIATESKGLNDGPLFDVCGTKANAERSICDQMDHIFNRFDYNVMTQMYLQCVIRFMHPDLQTVEFEVWLAKQYLKQYCTEDLDSCGMKIVKKMLNNPESNPSGLPFLLESNVSALQMEVIYTGPMMAGNMPVCTAFKLILCCWMIVQWATLSYQ